MGRIKYIPNHNMIPPGNGPAPKKTIQENEPVYSAYTGKQVWTGPMPYGIKCDAPKGEPNYGKNYHAMQHIPATVPYWAVHMDGTPSQINRPNIYGQQQIQPQIYQPQIYQPQMGMGAQNQNLVHQMYQQMHNQMW